MSRRIQLFLGAAGAALILIIAVPGQKEREPTSVATAFPIAPSEGLSGTPVGIGPRPTPVQEDRAARLARQAERAVQIDRDRDPFARTIELARAEASELVEPAAVAVFGQPAAPPAPRLQGLSRVGDSWMALIDRETVAPGARLSSGHEVVAIDRDGVTLRFRDEELVLDLGGEE